MVLLRERGSAEKAEDFAWVISLNSGPFPALAAPHFPFGRHKYWFYFKIFFISNFLQFFDGPRTRLRFKGQDGAVSKVDADRNF